MKLLDLFSGIGGFSLGLEATGAFETIAFCEREPYCQQVLKKHWPQIGIYDDIHGLSEKLEADDIHADIITGGFPCQPFSCAGKQSGKADDRYLWPAMLDVIAQQRPAWVIGENVAGIIGMELDTVLFDLEAQGYATRTFVIPACAVDAPHRRDRVWIVCHANGNHESDGALHEVSQPSGMGAMAHAEVLRKPQPEPEELHCQGPSDRAERSGADVADAAGAGWRPEGGTGQAVSKSEAQQRSAGCGGAARESEWEPNAGICRISHGIPHRVDRLRGLGNAVVPQIVTQIGYAIAYGSGYGLQ